MTFEEILAYIAAQLTEPVDQQTADDEAVVFSSGDPGEVIVRLTGTTVTVAAYSLAWEGPHTPFVEPILVGTVEWARIPAEAAMRAVKALIAGARDARLATFGECRLCGQRKPPEWMFGEDVCGRCAEEEHADVVH